MRHRFPFLTPVAICLSLTLLGLTVACIFPDREGGRGHERGPEGGYERGHEHDHDHDHEHEHQPEYHPN